MFCSFCKMKYNYYLFNIGSYALFFCDLWLVSQCPRPNGDSSEVADKDSESDRVSIVLTRI